MQEQITTDSPVTLYIKFPQDVFPRFFSLKKMNGETEYFRQINGRLNRIKLNLPNPGTYKSNYPFEIVKKVGIEIPKPIILPPAERNRWKQVTYRDNPSLKGTPAVIYSNTGVIEHSPEYYKYPRAVQIFIDLHEQGHMFYETEEYCDMWALVNYLQMGYNRSTAYWTLSNVLKRTPQNVKRIETLITNIKKTQTNAGA